MAKSLMKINQIFYIYYLSKKKKLLKITLICH